MRFIILAILFTVTLAPSAQEWGEYTASPNPVLAITEALVHSGIDCFTPRLYQEDGLQFSYGLVSVRYLGCISHGQEKRIMGTAFFIRSSPLMEDSPPARGHGYLVCLTEDFDLVSFCELVSPDEVILSGMELLREGEQITDFSLTDSLTVMNGYLVDGGSFLEYPFSE